jgi:hypothetical protein
MDDDAYYAPRVPRQPVLTRDHFRNTHYGYDDVEDGDEYEGDGEGVEFDSFGTLVFCLICSLVWRYTHLVGIAQS